MTDLIADIGATNARFQLVQNGGRVGEVWVGATADYSDISTLIRDALDALVADTQPRSALIAAAGPVRDDGDIEITNTGLHVSSTKCEEVIGGSVRLVNDFYAVASGVPYFSSLHQIGGDAPADLATKAVLGPGSGLGMATITPIPGGGWAVLSGEGGHADFSPTSHLETELWSVLMQDLGQELGHVSWETVLSGTGLTNLYRATATMWGAKPDDRSAAEISEAGVSMMDPICHQSLELFASLLGCAAGNLALTVGAKGGVYIAGGIAPQMVDFLSGSPLRRRFEEKGLMQGYVKPIPIYVVTEAEPGLIGASACLAQSVD